MASILPSQKNSPTNNSYGMFTYKPVAQAKNTKNDNKLKSFSINSAMPIGGALVGTGIGYLVYDTTINKKLRKLKADPEVKRLNKLLIGFKDLLIDYSEEKEEKLGLVFGEPLELKKDPVARNEDLKQFVEELEKWKQKTLDWNSDAMFKSFKKKLLIIGAASGLVVGGLALGIKCLVSMKKKSGVKDANSKN